MSRRAVLLVYLGTPQSLTWRGMRQFLAPFLSDPLLIRLPRFLRWANPLLGRSIALGRAAHALCMYRAIWTPEGSPLRVIAKQQAHALDARLGPDWTVRWAVRYGRPAVAEVLSEWASSGTIEEIVVFPQFPQFSRSTTGSALREAARWQARQVAPATLRLVGPWWSAPAYLDAQAAVIRRTIDEAGWTPATCRLIFSAHSLPLAHVEAGDPYPQHVEASARGVAERLGLGADEWAIGYQSRFGPTKWLEPSTEAVVDRLIDAGHRHLVVCPISFTVDCLETLEELGIRLVEHARARDAELRVCPALNTEPDFIDALAEVVARTGPALADEHPCQPSGTRTAG